MYGIQPGRHEKHDGEHPDVVAHSLRGRGAGLNPPNRFDGIRLSILGDHLDEQAAEHPEGVQLTTNVSADRTQRILNPVDSPDLDFRWTLNPYRGCEHGCVYCYARPTHEMLGFSCGVDFETRIVAKHDAPLLLRRELGAPDWMPETVAMSGVTDCYQPVERELRLTRGCMEIFAECRHPVSIVTKNRLILRDIDLLADLARQNLVRVAISVTTLDSDLSRRMEPRACAPNDRLETIRALSDAGVHTMVMLAPVIPGLNDREVPAILEACADAGASGAGWMLLRLPYQVKALFVEWLSRHFPDRAGRVLRLVQDTRGGELYRSRYGERFRGTGEMATQIKRTFELFARRYRLDGPMLPLATDLFLRPSCAGQLPLFGDGRGA